MNTTDNKHSEIRWGKFKDSKKENEYMMQQVQTQKRFIRMGMLVFSCAFLFFLIPDCLFNQSLEFRIKMIVIRISVFIILLIASFILSKLSNWRTILWIVTFCEFLVSLVYLHITLLYENPHFMLQLMSLVLILLIFFIIPNRLLNSVIVSTFTWILFVISTKSNIPYIPHNEYLSGFIFPFLFMVAFFYRNVRFQEEKHIQFSSNQHMLYLLNHDALTSVYNRYKFETELNQFLLKKDGESVPLTLTLLDIDYFKQINDTKGHIHGDRVLVFLASLIQSHLTERDLLARWGGEEFVIIFYNTSLEEAVTKIQTIKTALETKKMEGQSSITCSYGITQIQQGDTLDCLVHRADQLMYQAKENGRNQIAF